MHILSKKFDASHELTLSSSCLITAERLDNLLNHQIKSKMNSKRREGRESSESMKYKLQ